MKLSLWTIMAELEARDFSLTSSIAEGLPRINAFRTNDHDSYDVSFLEVLPWDSFHSTKEGDVVLACSFEYIIVHDTDVLTVCNALGEIFNQYSEWENTLCLKMIENASLQDILDIGASVFHRPMFIKNNSNWTFAITRGYSANTHPYWSQFEESINHRNVEYDSIRAVSTDPVFQNVFLEKYPSVSRSPSYGAMVLHANVFSENKRIAEIVALENGRTFNHGEPHLMHVFASLVEKFIQNHPEILLSVSDPGTYLVPLLETGQIEPEKLAAVYHAANLTPEDELCMVVIQGHLETDTPLLGVFKDKISLELPKSAVFLYKNRIICIAGLDEKRTYSKLIKTIEVLLQADNFPWAVSYEFMSLDRIPEYYNQASMVLEKVIEQDKEHLSMYEAAPACISDLLVRYGNWDLMIHPDVIRLSQTDKEEGTQYAETLYNFLLCGGNFTDTATLMGLHRNSLIYRMNKIRQIMHTNPDDIKNRELLLISFILYSSKELPK